MKKITNKSHMVVLDRSRICNKRPNENPSVAPPVVVKILKIEIKVVGSAQSWVERPADVNIPVISGLPIDFSSGTNKLIPNTETSRNQCINKNCTSHFSMFLFFIALTLCHSSFVQEAKILLKMNGFEST